MNVLLIAYKIEKDKGSEDGTGYNLVKGIAAQVNHVTLITRSNNIPALKNDPAFSSVRLIGVDVPKWLGFYKKKSRGVILYYYFWQIFVGKLVNNLQKKNSFDVIHQINFHATWAPHFIKKAKAKIILGPLTHHPSIPWAYWYESNLAFIKELIRRAVKFFFLNLNLQLQKSLQRCHHIFLGHDDIKGFYKNHISRISILPQAGSEFPTLDHKTPTPVFHILFVGRFVSLKGCVPALQAIEKMAQQLNDHERAKFHVTFIGEGPIDLPTRRLSVPIKILSWQPQKALSDYYKQASLFLFPSLEGQGLVVAEALAHGCPVLCLKDTGPATVAGDGTITIGKDNVIHDLSVQLYALAREYWYQPETYQNRIALALKRADALSWAEKINKIMEQYRA